MATPEYTPTREDTVNVITLLYENGISVQSTKVAYNELQKYQAMPPFSILLAAVFGSETCPVPECSPPGPWVQYRQLAGIVLKNNLEKAQHALGEAAVKKAASCALQVLQNPADIRLARTAAMIVNKITALTSIGWWQSAGLSNLPELLFGELVSGDSLRILAGLYTLQYIMEDSPKQVGQDSEVIIERASHLIFEESLPMDIRKAAFRMCVNIYEYAVLLDWNTDDLSPLQTGLCNASASFSMVCTKLLSCGAFGDSFLMTHALRTCVAMLEYLVYFAPRLGQQEAAALVQWWVHYPIEVMGKEDCRSSMSTAELKAAAIEVILRSLHIFQETGGEGPIVILTEAITPLLPVLVHRLTLCAPMSDDEVRTIMAAEELSVPLSGCSTGKPANSSTEQQKDIGEDTFLDEDEAAMTLRSAAMRCIEAVCSFDGNVAFPLLLREIEQMWSSTDNRLREAGIALVGVIAGECYYYISAHLPFLVPQLLEWAKGGEHICVTSSAMWSLSRVAQWLLVESKQPVLPSVVPVLLRNMQVKSNRLQQAAVSALNTLFVHAENYHVVSLMYPLLPDIIQALHSCLPVYAGDNYSLLCDLALHTLAQLPDEHLEAFAAPFKNDRMQRTTAFVESYSATYITESTGAFIRKEVFSIDRVSIAFLIRCPNSSQALEALSTWCDVLKDIAQRDIKDDPDLVSNAQYICCRYVEQVTTQPLAQWAAHSNGSLAAAAHENLRQFTNHDVRQSSLQLLLALLKGGGADVLPSGKLDTILSSLIAMLRDSDDPQLKLSIVAVAVQMIVTDPRTPMAHVGNIEAIGSTLRSDVFSDSLLCFAAMACALCEILPAAPQLVAHLPVAVIASLLAQSDNSSQKSVATSHLSNALAQANTPNIAVCLREIMRMVYSWQESAGQFPGLRESISAMIQSLKQRHPSELRALLQTIPPSLAQMLAANYNL